MNFPRKVNILCNIKLVTKALVPTCSLEKTCRNVVWNVLFLFLDLFDRVPSLVTDYSHLESTSSEATGSKDALEILIFHSKLHAQ